ncbi:MAG: hypothetical protein ACOCTU_06750 [Bacteroidota bacterium]
MKTSRVIRFVDSTNPRSIDAGFKPSVQVWIYDNIHSGIPDEWEDGGEFDNLEEAARYYNMDINKIKLHRQWYPGDYPEIYIINE